MVSNTTTERQAGANIYNNTGNIIQFEEKYVKQEVYSQYTADGKTKDIKRYRATTSVLKTSVDGGKGEYIIVEYYVDPNEYQINKR